jgi:hypothetical protein
MHQRILHSRSTGPRLVGPPPFVNGIKPTSVKATKVIVCGTRDFDDYEYAAKKLDIATYWFDVVEVIIGSHGQKVERNFEYINIGADAFGKRWAEWNWWTYKTFWADWDNLGKKAGPVRNTEMARYAGPEGYCVAFRKRKGKSSGTDDMIAKFRRYCDPTHLRIYYY